MCVSVCVCAGAVRAVACGCVSAHADVCACALYWHCVCIRFYVCAHVRMRSCVCMICHALPGMNMLIFFMFSLLVYIQLICIILSVYALYVFL